MSEMKEASKTNARPAGGAPAGVFAAVLMFGPVGVVAIGIALISVLIVLGAGLMLVAPSVGQDMMGIGSFLILVFVFAIIFGVPSYALVFGPMAWIAYRQGIRSALPFGVLGGLANVVAWPLAIGVLMLSGETSRQATELANFIHGFGLVFAPLYGASFGWALDRFARPRPGVDARRDGGPERAQPVQ